MKLAAQIFFITAVLSVGGAVGVAVVKERSLPEHITKDILASYSNNEDAAQYALGRFREYLPEYNASVRALQKALDRLGPVEGMIYDLGSRKERSTEYRRFEEWPILDQKLMSKEEAEAARVFARASTTYAAESYDCFLPGIGIEWRDSKGRTVRQVICLSCKNLHTYCDNEPESISLPLSDEAMTVWSNLYRTYFPDSK